MNLILRVGLVTLVALSSSACAATTGRFKDQPIVWEVADDRDIPEPAEHDDLLIVNLANALGFDRIDRGMRLADYEPAHNINALDEVPNSRWFTNRIGLRDMSIRELVLGPDNDIDDGGPPQPPLVVVKGKGGPEKPGFLAKDATDRTFIMKFDLPEYPELETATSVIVNRIMWAAGYNVPSDHFFRFRRAQITVSPKATRKNDLGEKIPYREADLDEALTGSPLLADGSYRASSSLFLSGKPMGGWSPKGRRQDDPNDHVDHEHRRELRGLRVIASWVNHTDVKPDNTLSMYVEENGRHFLKHYFVDFGEALGGHVAEWNRPDDGYVYLIDAEQHGLAFLSLGLWVQPWENLVPTRWPSIGLFSAHHFDPLGWHDAYAYEPFIEMDAADGFWGAKIVMRFRRKQIEALVATGGLSDPDAAKYLVDVLVKRRNAIGRAYFALVTPLDRLAIRPGALCMTDLAVRYGLSGSGLVERLRRDDSVRSVHRVRGNGRVCLPIPAHDRYTIYRLRVRRNGDTTPPLQIHFKGGERARILGLVRTEP